MDTADKGTAEILQEARVVLTDGHFVYPSSGRHGHWYVDSERLFALPKLTARLISELASELYNSRAETIVGLGAGGALLAYCLACQMSILTKQDIAAARADLSPRSFGLTRTARDLVAHKKIWVVADVLTATGELRAVVGAARAIRAQVIGAAALVSHGSLYAEDFGVNRLHSLLILPMKDWPEEECPLCARGTPVNINYGAGEEYLRGEIVS